MDCHETLREPIQDDIDSESPPKSICGGRLERNGRSGGVSESSWRHLRPSSGPLGPFRRPLGAIMDRHEILRERIQEDLDSEPPPKPFFEDASSETVVLREIRQLAVPCDRDRVFPREFVIYLLCGTHSPIHSHHLLVPRRRFPSPSSRAKRPFWGNLSGQEREAPLL